MRFGVDKYFLYMNELNHPLSNRAAEQAHEADGPVLSRSVRGARTRANPVPQLMCDVLLHPPLASPSQAALRGSTPALCTRMKMFGKIGCVPAIRRPMDPGDWGDDGH